MMKIWETLKPFTIMEIAADLYVINFELQADKEKVLQGRPWLFDAFLFNLKPYDGFTLPSQMEFSTTTFCHV